MSDLQTIPLAILCSDLHLRETVPRSRAEPDWYEVMANQLDVLRLQSSGLDAPIICAGDVFDKWNPSARLVSFAIDHLPKMYAIPGQHDLEGHLLSRRYKGAYGALCKAGKIFDIPANEWFRARYECRYSGRPSLWLWAMPWGQYEMPIEITQGMDDIRLGVLHQYRWSNANNKHPMAEDSSKLESLFPGLDALLIGDNHISWELPGILNHGGFIPQNSDQKDHRPHYGVLYADGHIERKPYDTPAPQWVEEWVPEAPQAVADGLIRELESLENTGDSFVERLRMAVESESDSTVKDKLREIYEKVTT